MMKRTLPRCIVYLPNPFFKNTPKNVAFYSIIGSRHANALNVSTEHNQIESRMKYLLNGRNFDGVTFVYKELLDKNIKPNENILKLQLQALCKLNNVEEAERIHDTMKKEGLSSLESFCTLIRMYFKLGNIEKAIECFKETREYFQPNIKLYNTMMKGFAECRKTEEAKMLLKEMEDEGIQPNIETLNHFISSVIKEGTIEKTNSILEMINRTNLIPNIDTFHIIMKTFKIPDIPHLIRIMEENYIIPNSVTILTILNLGYVQKGYGVQSIQLCEQLMKQYWIKETPHIFNKMIRILTNEGEIERALAIYENMKKNQLQLNEFTYGPLLNYFMQKRDFVKVQLLIREMEELQIKPNLYIDRIKEDLFTFINKCI